MAATRHRWTLRIVLLLSRASSHRAPADEGDFVIRERAAGVLRQSAVSGGVVAVDRERAAGGAVVDPVQMAVEAKGRRKSLRELPDLVRSALVMTWAASRSRTLLVFGVQALTSLALFAQVLLVKWVLDAFLEVGDAGGVGDAVLPVALLAGLTAATTIASTVANLQQRVLGELVSRVVWRRVLDVSQAVELSAYEDPAFYDQAQRVQSSAARQTQIVVQALVTCFGGLLGVVAGTIAVLTLAPALLPLLLLSGVPLFLTSRVSGRQEFDFAVRESTRQRERGYLQMVLTRRDEAKEVRAFTLAAALRRRWEGVYGDHLHELSLHVRRRVRLALLGNVAAAVLTAGTLLIALVLVDRGWLSIASAGAALVAVRLLGSRVGDTALGLSTIYESALFLSDLRAFLSRPTSVRTGRPAAGPHGLRAPGDAGRQLHLPPRRAAVRPRDQPGDPPG